MGRKFTPRRSLNPLLIRKALASGVNQKVLAQVAGFPSYNQYHSALRTPMIAASPLMVNRLVKLAEILRKSGIDFNDDEIFIDSPQSLVKRQAAE